MAPLYCIVFMGELVPGLAAEQIITALAARCGMTQQRARELILGGRRAVLKCGLDPAEAQRYSSELREIGLVVELEPEGRMPAAGQSLEIDLDRTVVLAKRPAFDGNPYAAPKADLTAPASGWSGEALHPPRAVSAGRGWGWIAEAWALFADRPWAWIGATLLLFVISFALNFVPFVGGLAMVVLGPIFTGGLMIGAHTQHQGGGFTVKQLFVAFERQPGDLAWIGAANLGVTILIVLFVGVSVAIALALAGPDLTAATHHEGFDPAQLAQLGPLVLVFMLCCVLVGFLWTMCILFAPALVALNEVPVLSAFSLSFQGCWRNVLSFLVFGLVAMALSLACVLTLGLGFLVLVPLLTIAIYMAYRDIYYR
ncbi:BPSS1780 family membrane protein [uncultured Thiodictyon sp.]|uniref:BPSS1780 family membrane protein n=1 Tax=uncultured Thiodictyon sp. TaxID=1846217 RepID=UPI0025CC067F|nr:BPSS1780 family membrane protein [uncultured Thiodictyon sp.]